MDLMIFKYMPISAQILAMILEVTMEFLMELAKLTAFGNFPRVFLWAKTYAKNIFKHDVDLVDIDGEVGGSDQYTNQEKIDSYD